MTREEVLKFIQTLWGPEATIFDRVMDTTSSQMNTYKHRYWVGNSAVRARGTNEHLFGNGNSWEEAFQSANNKLKHGSSYFNRITDKIILFYAGEFKPVEAAREIEHPEGYAVQFTGDNCISVLRWSGNPHWDNLMLHTTDNPFIDTSHGAQLAEAGDWVVKDLEGNLHLCRPVEPKPAPQVDAITQLLKDLPAIAEESWRHEERIAQGAFRDSRTDYACQEFEKRIAERLNAIKNQSVIQENNSAKRNCDSKADSSSEAITAEKEAGSGVEQSGDLERAKERSAQIKTEPDITDVQMCFLSQIFNRYASRYTITTGEEYKINRWLEWNIERIRNKEKEKQ